MRRCTFCVRPLTNAAESLRGDVCDHCYRRRRLPVSGEQVPALQHFAAAFTPKQREPWTPEEAMRFNARRLRERHLREIDASPIRLDRLY